MDNRQSNINITQNEKAETGLSQWELMYRKFKKNRLAILGVFLLIICYGLAIFAGFIAPYHVRTTNSSFTKAPPQFPKFIDSKGNFHLRPFVYEIELKRDPETFISTYKINKEKMYPLYFLIHGEKYKFWNFFWADIHLFGVKGSGKIFLFGTDENSRDLFSRILYGSRVSLTVGLVGVLLSVLLGAFLGIASGYWGGILDNFIQRSIEILLSFPRIPLWLALSAALPPDWSPIKNYFGITIILSIVSWGGLARQLRGKILALRDREFVLASKAAGAGTFYIIKSHLLPNSLSHIIVIATLSVPSMILGETALSFLGLGIRPPMTSWGVLLEEAQHSRVLLQTPWMVIPVFFVIISVLAFNFVGDGLRDAADPFSN